jgi:hypothetical protein
MKKAIEKSVSKNLMDDLEPILDWEGEGGYVYPEIHPTEHDESDELEAAKKIVDAIKVCTMKK